jgi:glycine/D-amino acid oxidase-like deaminating enzyme
MDDVLVIEGGASGLNAAIILSRARRRVLVVDSGRPRNAPTQQLGGFVSRCSAGGRDRRGALCIVRACPVRPLTMHCSLPWPANGTITAGCGWIRAG